MIVEMRTAAQAASVVKSAPWCRQLLNRTPDRDGVIKLSRRIDVGDDLEAARAAVEAVSVLFSVYAGTAAEFEATGELGVEVASGWSMTGARFEVAWPDERGVVTSHFGGRRFAYNWALGQVKADMDAKKADPTHRSVDWSLAGLRKEWNSVKATVAPWWEANSKETYSSGIADLVTALGNWKSSRAGTRKGAKVGFPGFKSKHSDARRVRFTTGAMRFEPDRRTITVPVIGALRSMENTRRVERHFAAGRARIMNMTVTERWGRLFVSVNYAVRTSTIVAVAQPGTRAGVDLGLRSLATVVDDNDVVTVYPNPAPLRATMNERRRTARQMSRRIPGSRGHRQAKATLARLDRRAVNLRQQAAHTLTSELVATYSQVVIEDLNLAAMKKSMGRRAFRRSVSDAGLGAIRPMLNYKAALTGCEIIVADRWFPSSQIHHGCGCRLIAPRKLAKMLICAVTGELVDRDDNAALNLRDWPDNASWSAVSAPAPLDTPTSSTVGTGGSDRHTSVGRRRPRKTPTPVEAAAEEARTEPQNIGARKLRKEERAA